MFENHHFRNQRRYVRIVIFASPVHISFRVLIFATPVFKLLPLFFQTVTRRSSRGPLVHTKTSRGLGFSRYQEPGYEISPPPDSYVDIVVQGV